MEMKIMMILDCKITRQMYNFSCNNITNAFWIGLFIRCFIAWLLPFLMDNNDNGGGSVMYTDIDYYVFTDGAEYIQKGFSPYHRTTYRYTPFLAYLLSKLPYQKRTSRYFFCIADTICGYIIVRLRQKERIKHTNDNENTNRSTNEQKNIDNTSNNDKKTTCTNDNNSMSFQDAIWWLYNPLAINICTRGSAESFIVLLPVLITTWIVLHATIYNRNNNENSNNTTTVSKIIAPFVSGIWHGIAIHAKLYPIIYTLSFMISFTEYNNILKQQRRQQQQSSLYAFNNIVLIIQLLFKPQPIIFGMTCVITFLLLTHLSIIWYGSIALQEGLLYHFSRVDHRHNYSMHWYWIYLLRAITATQSNGIYDNILTMEWIGRLLLIPQIILLAISSIYIAPNNLPLALFVQTFLFVTHNKVITAQYFTWYLCLLPLCNQYSFQQQNSNNNNNKSTSRLDPRIVKAILFLLISILFWLSSAYCFEMQGMAVHLIVWIASVLFFIANVNLLSALLASSSTTTTKTTTTTPISSTKQKTASSATTIRQQPPIQQNISSTKRFKDE